MPIHTYDYSKLLGCKLFCRWLGDWQKYIRFFDQKTKYISITNWVAALTKISNYILILEFGLSSLLYMVIEVGSKEREVS